MRRFGAFCAALVLVTGGGTAALAAEPQAAQPSPAEPPARALAPLKIIDITPQPGETVGIGMPIIVKFNRVVRDKKAVEKLMVVRSQKPAVGAWYWTTVGGRPAAIFRTQNGRYWKPNQKVAFAAKLPKTAPIKHVFRIGNAHYVTASATKHRLTAYQNGKKVRSWPVSMGSGGEVWSDGVDHLLTTSGVHLVMAHSRLERMRPPGKKPGDKGWYDELIPWAVRISASGEYIHQNMSDPSCLGRRNCSHGCLRSPSADAKWFYRWSYRGDIVKITGTKRKLDWNNGWSYYQMPWKKWVSGGALKRVVRT